MYKHHYKLSSTFEAKGESQEMVIDVGQGDKKKKNVKKNPTKSGEVDPYFNSMSSNNAPFKERFPITFVFKALKNNTSYTIEPRSMAKKGEVAGFAKYKNILAGEPNHVRIKNSEILCIDGYLREPNEEILITTNNDNKDMLKNLILNAKLRNKETTVNKTIVNNVIALTIVDKNPKQIKPYGTNNYEICMKLETGKEGDD